MKNILLLASFLVCAVCALPAYEQPVDTNNDPQEYKNIEILLLESAVDQDGGYSFSFENDDGSRVAQEGQHKMVDDDHAVESIRGSYSYNDVNGQPVSVTYTADENGFRPFGAHLPTSPPIPPEILRSLKFLATAKPFVDEQLYDYKPKEKVFRGKQYTSLNAVQQARSQLRSHRFSELSGDGTPRDALFKSAKETENTKTRTASERGGQYNNGNVVQRSRNQFRSSSYAEPSADGTPRDALLKSAEETENTKTGTTSVSGGQYNNGNVVQRHRGQFRSSSFAEPSADETPRDALLKSAEETEKTKTGTTSVSGGQYNNGNVVQRHRGQFRSSSFAEPSADEKPRDALLKSAEDDTITETTPSDTTQKDDTNTETTTSETILETSTEAIKASVADVVNEAKKKINEAWKESIEKTSQLAHSATKETGSAAVTAAREEADKLKDAVKLQVTKIQSAVQSRGNKKYAGIVSDAVSFADGIVVGLVPPEEEDRSWYS